MLKSWFIRNILSKKTKFQVSRYGLLVKTKLQRDLFVSSGLVYSVVGSNWTLKISKFRFIIVKIPPHQHPTPPPPHHHSTTPPLHHSTTPPLHTKKAWVMKLGQGATVMRGRWRGAQGGGWGLQGPFQIAFKRLKNITSIK